MIASEPSWELYGTFLAVMREGSLSAAARALGLAQPTVRRRIEELEEALDVVLFTRATNGLVPTEAAHATLSHAEAMAASASAVVRTLSGPTDAERGTVRITASEIIGVEVLPTLLPPLMRAHPQLQIEIAPTNRTQDLLRRDADIAIRMVAPTQASLVAKRATVIPIGFFAHADVLAVAVRKPADLRGRLVGADVGRGMIDALAAYGVPTTRKDYVVRTDSDLAQLSAVRAGLGIGICQVPLAARWPELVRVLPSVEVPLEAWVAMHEDQRAVRRIRVVFDALVDGLAVYVARARLATPKAKPARPARHT